tara:strand:- start:193 stop:618 length:426 start_codon:yes stop_codon:yes gene_type:complete
MKTKEMELKVSKELALEEVEKWLSFKKVDQDEIEDIDSSKNNLANAIMRGHLILDKSHNLVHTLKFPILDEDGKPALSVLTYKPRLMMQEIEQKTQSINMKNTFELLRAYVAALTGVNSGLIKKLDTSDHKISQTIALFFL